MRSPAEVYALASNYCRACRLDEAEFGFSRVRAAHLQHPGVLYFLEGAYRGMWQSWCSGRTPEATTTT